MDGRTYGRTDGRTENLPILQDFVPYRGRCPAKAQLQPKNSIKQGKGTADHMMPLGKLPLAGLRASEAWLAGAFLVGLGP